jgi:hypothetical protein
MAVHLAPNTRQGVQWRYEYWIARRNITWSVFKAAEAALVAARAQHEDISTLKPFIGEYNSAQKLYEHAVTDLIAERVRFRDWMSRHAS